MIEVGGRVWDVQRAGHKGRSGPGRPAPAEFRDAVELHARKSGAHADIVWVPEPVNMWQVRITLKPNDPRRRGDSGVETVELHEWLSAEEWRTKDPRSAPRDAGGRIRAGYRSYELDELGVSGVVEILEKGSLTSGRGQFDSALEAANHVQERHKTSQERTRRSKRDDAKHTFLDQRRRVLKIPFLPVGIELNSKESSS